MTSIRGRLLATLLAGLATVLAAGGTAVYWIAHESLMRELDAGLESRAQALASVATYEPVGLTFDPVDADDLVGAASFELRRLSGELLEQSDDLDGTALPIRVPINAETVCDDVELPGGIAGRAVWLAFEPSVEEDEPFDGKIEAHEVLLAAGDGPEMLVLTLALDRRPTDRALATLLATLLLVGGGVAVTVGMLVPAGVRWGLRPLDRLSRQLGGMRGDTVSRRVDDAGAPRELAPVYRELNGMLDRVERTLVRERSFADAAAHELRTPLAELRTTTDVALRWPDPARATATLDEVRSIGMDMERLVEALLLISRGNAEPNGRAGDVPVAPIVRACIERDQESIDEKNLTVTVDADALGALRAPREAMEIILRNVIGNAIHYTPSHGRIAIGNGHVTNGARSLVVENGPVDLNDVDVEQLFQPFWRTDVSRTDRAHVGLGLAVVERIAQATGMCVEADLTGDRLSIRVTGAA